jgi:UDP-N-acetylmuramoyl-tripeptide--D-alanyl-D-alanine ligase
MTGPVLWTAADAAAATGGRAVRAWQASGVSIDSRTLEPGDLFFALRGPNHDGHGFIGAALAAGAAAVVATAAPEDAPALIVEDTMAALQCLAAAGRARSTARIVAVTGSVGKTGTKEMLAAALAALGPTSATRGNLNNQWGLPLSLARMPRDAAFGAFEIGMNHAGEIRPLARLVRPHVAIVTTVDKVHAAFFDSVEAIADAKAEIFEGLEPGGTAVLNADNPHFDRLARHAQEIGVSRIVGFGASPTAEVRLVDCALDARGSTVMAIMDGTTLTYRLSLPGRHWALNSLAVLAAVSALDGEVKSAAAALKAVTPLRGRGTRETIEAGPYCRFEIIDESYNASPVSVRAGIAVLGQSRPGRGGRRIAVLGDMLELGDTARQSHTALAPDLEAADIDLVFACGPEMRALYDALPARMQGAYAADSAALAARLAQVPQNGDVILVKGSLGVRMVVVVARLQALAERLPSAAGGR